MQLTRAQQLKILEAYNRRHAKVKALRESCFPEQLAFIDDPSKQKAAQCTRRSGKSYGGAGVYLCSTCIEYPRATCLYIATTREQARRILLKDVLSEINRNHSLGMKVNLTTLTVSFPNDSLIYLMGLDSKPEEMEKALGQKYRLVVIDEGGSWRQDQRKMIYDVLQPACADYQGTIAMLGSPVNNIKTHFYEVTGLKESDPGYVPGWAVHRWSWQNNPHVRVNMQKQIDRMIAANPNIMQTPGFRQMYLNEWVVDPGALCYKYDLYRNSISSLPSDNRYSFAVGVDLGFNDPTAIVVSAYSEYDPTMYFVEVIKLKEADLSTVAEHLNQVRLKYNPYKWVVDGAAKQAVAELKNRFGFPFEPADKTGKYEMIQLMNNDFISGRIKLVMPGCAELEDEYNNLVWDEKSRLDRTKKTVENSACANHAADGSLYSWRMCYHYAAREHDLIIHPNSEEAMELWAEKEARKLKRKGERDWFMEEMGEAYGMH